MKKSKKKITIEDRRKEPECPFCGGPVVEMPSRLNYVFIECVPCRVIIDGYTMKRKDDYDSS
jgi:ribosomal protein L37AE/L43A